MAVKALTEQQKDAAVLVYQSKTRTIKQIAGYLGISTRTLGRILVEKGVMPAKIKKTEQDEQLLTMLRDHNIGVKEINEIFAMPVLNKASVQQFLNNCSQEELAGMFYQAGIVKVSEMYNMQVQNAMLKYEQAAKKSGKNTEPSNVAH